MIGFDIKALQGKINRNWEQFNRAAKRVLEFLATLSKVKDIFVGISYFWIKDLDNFEYAVTFSFIWTNLIQFYIFYIYGLQLEWFR